MCMIERMFACDLLPSRLEPSTLHFLKHLATIRVLMCMGSSSNAMFVSIHFVSTGVTLVLCNGSTFINLLIHSEVSQIFHFLFTSLAHCIPRQFLAADVINAQDALVFSLTSANIARFSRLRHAKPLMIHLHNSLRPDLSFPRQCWNSPIFQLFQLFQR